MSRSRKRILYKLTQEWLDNNDILMYLTHNEGKSVIAERFIKARIYKKLDDRDDRVRITKYKKYKNLFSKGYTENWSREIFIIDSLLKTNPRT